MAFLVSGAIIIVTSIWRYREYKSFNKHRDEILKEIWNSREDDVPEEEFRRCISHQWVMENITNKTSTPFQDRINELVNRNTLLGTLCIGMFLGGTALVIVLLFVGSIIVTGVMLVIVAIGISVAIGPGSQKVSTQLLRFQMKQKRSQLNSQDVVYASIAFQSVRNWLGTSTAIGVTFLILAPFGNVVPELFANGVAYLSWTFFLQPALSLNMISPILAVGYLALVIPFFFYIILVVGRVIVSRLIKQTSIPTEIS